MEGRDSRPPRPVPTGSASSGPAGPGALRAAAVPDGAAGGDVPVAPQRRRNSGARDSAAAATPRRGTASIPGTADSNVLERHVLRGREA